MRIMGLDVGDKTIGIAISDALGLTAQGVEVIRRTGGFAQDLKRLKELVREQEVTKIVVGLPRNMNGTIGPQGEKVMEFINEIEEGLGLPVETWDERLTTVQAERLLISADMSRAKRRKVIDKMAASLILQGFLDSRPHSL
ncbi:MAG: Holliday junction resolvase RuvX [Firmicutes bacterium]|nr:Holliday junction resolvase RuvX [Bacillota bacterium]